MEFSFRPTGIGRWFNAVFLAVWLCGWAAGELFALWFLVTGAGALLTGTPLGPGQAPLEWSIAAFGGLFLLVWLALWTIGGFAAGHALLGSLWGYDRLVCGGGRLEIERRLGPFTSHREIPIGEIVGFDIALHDGALRVETAREMVDVTRLGTREEREAAARALTAHVRPRPLDTPVLPPEWQEIIGLDGTPALVPNLDTRRKQAIVATIAAAVVGVLALPAIVQAVAKPASAVLALILVTLFAGLAWGAVRLATTRSEWRLSKGSLVLSRHGLGDARELFTARALEFSRMRDSDGDDWYYLDAVAAPGQPKRTFFDRGRRRLAKSFQDPWLPKRLGEFIAARTGIRLETRR